MIKTVSDAALAGISALVGPAVASLFGGKFSESVFKLGLYAYAAYDVLLPCVFGLTHLVLRYRISRRGYEAEEARIVSIIGRDRVQRVVARGRGKGDVANCRGRLGNLGEGNSGPAIVRQSGLVPRASAGFNTIY